MNKEFKLTEKKIIPQINYADLKLGQIVLINKRGKFFVGFVDTIRSDMVRLKNKDDCFFIIGGEVTFSEDIFTIYLLADNDFKKNLAGRMDYES